MDQETQHDKRSTRVPDTRVRWKIDLSEAITSLEELMHVLELEEQQNPSFEDPRFRFLVTRHFVSKMRRGDWKDPLLLQILPTHEETSQDGCHDPVGDLPATSTPGLLHKYHRRVLLVSTGACAIHCRYCFRQHYPYERSQSNALNRAGSMSYIRENKDIREVILSGGDPLMLDDQKIENLLREIGSIPHVRWLRIHTRIPIVLPSRMTKDLLSLITNTCLRTTIVIHANHPNELSEEQYEIFQHCRSYGLDLLNQSVLLRGINDRATTLIELSEKLYEYGVHPYYLHCLDPVRGAMHFDVAENDGISIIAEMREKLPGYLVPRLVREEIGKPSKTAIFDI